MFASNTSQVSSDATYIEDVFSNFLYTGNGSTQTINNGIDLAGKGGLVWVKSRDVASGHFLYDTSRGVNQYLASNTTAASANYNSSLTAFNSNGFTLGFNLGNVDEKYASWTFRKQPKFFSCGTYTGDATLRQISHDLGVAPGFIVVKRTDSTGNWQCYHRSLGNAQLLRLNFTDAAISSVGSSGAWGETDPTATNFTVGSGTATNASGATYVWYAFAHNAGGFGLTGTDNVISCGSFTGGSSVNLGYEPQWLMYKRTDNVGNWIMLDTMRGFNVNDANRLLANTSGSEGAGFNSTVLTNTGFNASGETSGATYIYIAIRRGPMKTPTSGTSVYQAVTRTGNSPTVNSITSVGFPPDSIWQKRVSGSTASANVFDRLIGRFFLAPATTNAETAANTSATRDLISFDMTGFTVGEQWSSELNANTRPEVYWNFRRAPGFFDEVCYTGTGSQTTLNHNLGVAPEMIIVKSRSRTGEDWPVYHTGLGTTIGSRNLVYVNKNLAATTNADGPACFGNGTTIVAPTSSVFTVGTQTLTNAFPDTYVAYLFASCPGVSKVGSYTGNGSSQTINCGFTGGARFVMIKRTDSTGDWYVWDTARGIVSANDPRLSLNSTAAEVTTDDSIDPDNSGFIVNQVSATNINVSSATYIYLAIA